MLKKENFKKNLFRVKQMADQGLGRAEKTEVLSADLQNAEKRVELLKTVIQTTAKKIGDSLQARSITDPEKRLKKMPQVILSSSLAENSQTLADGMLSDIFNHAATNQNLLGAEMQNYESIVESSILSYFQHLLEVDIPAIKKTKNQLAKVTLDMDATRSRHVAATKHNSENPSSTNQSRFDSLKEELEDAENKVAASKDQYATEMLTFVSKEAEISEKIVMWMEAQAHYHRACLKHVEEVLPTLRSCIGQHLLRPVYGCPLEEHLESSGREIALVIEACISLLFHKGMEEEGLFRIAGSASKLKKLKAAFNVGTIIDMEEYYSDVHAVAGALKLYLRELPEPLLTFNLFPDFVKCMSVKDRDSRMKDLWTTVNKLPKPNFTNVRYLVKFLSRLAEKSDINKMTVSNIAIVFGPNLIWSPSEEDGTNVVLSAVQNAIVEMLVTNHSYFFPGDATIIDLESLSSSSSKSNSLVRLDSTSSASPPAVVQHAVAVQRSASDAESPLGHRDARGSLKDSSYTCRDVEASRDTSGSSNISPFLSASSLDSVDSGQTSTSPQIKRGKKPAPPPPPVPSHSTTNKVDHGRKPSYPPPNRPHGPPPACPPGPTSSVEETDSVRSDGMPERPKPAAALTSLLSGPSCPGQSALIQSEAAPRVVQSAKLTEFDTTSDQSSMSSPPTLSSQMSLPVGLSTFGHSRTPSSDKNTFYNVKNEPFKQGHARSGSGDFRNRGAPPPVPQRLTPAATPESPKSISVPVKNISEEQESNDIEREKSDAFETNTNAASDCSMPIANSDPSFGETLEPNHRTNSISSSTAL